MTSTALRLAAAMIVAELGVAGAQASPVPSLYVCTAQRAGRGAPWIATCELTGMRLS